MKYFLVISDLETGNDESTRLKGGSESHEQICFREGRAWLLEREGRKGISGVHYDVKVGARNQTDLLS